MSRVPPMASPAPPPPDAHQPRTVSVYRGMQIQDCRDRIQVVITGQLPRCVNFTLKNEGFRRDSNDTWSAPATPMTITAAQAIGATFFGDAK